MVNVQTNDPSNRSVKLTCSGKVLRAFTGSPPTVRFGAIERDAGPQTAYANLRRGDGGPIKPELVEPLPAGVEAKVEEVRPAELYRVNVTVSPPWPNTPIRRVLRIKTGVAEAPFEMIRLNAAVVPRLRVVPPKFLLIANSDGNFEHSLRLEWDRTATTKAARVSVNDPNLSVSLVEENGAQMVVLRGDASYRPSRVRPVVTIETDDPVVPRLTIQVKQSKRRAATARRAAKLRKAKINAAARKTLAPAPIAAPAPKPATQKPSK